MGRLLNQGTTIARLEGRDRIIRPCQERFSSFPRNFPGGPGVLYLTMKTPPFQLPRSILIIIFLLALAACSPGPRHTGILEGQVSIGPLVPVLREGEDPPTPAPEVYAARQIVVYKKNGLTEFTRLEIGPTGWYSGELPVGNYVVDINRIGIDSADNFPLEITISANSTIRLDINIDTGIR